MNEIKNQEPMIFDAMFHNDTYPRETQLQCPICECQNVHVTGTRKAVAGVHGGAWSGRGDLHVVECWSECGGEFEIRFGFHKGDTEIFLSVTKECAKDEEVPELEHSSQPRLSDDEIHNLSADDSDAIIQSVASVEKWDCRYIETWLTNSAACQLIQNFTPSVSNVSVRRHGGDWMATIGLHRSIRPTMPEAICVAWIKWWRSDRARVRED